MRISVIAFYVFIAVVLGSCLWLLRLRGQVRFATPAKVNHMVSVPKLTGHESLYLVASTNSLDIDKVDSALSAAGIPFEYDGSVRTGYRVRLIDFERARRVLRNDAIQKNYIVRLVSLEKAMKL